jgi:hypothetical protein
MTCDHCYCLIGFASHDLSSTNGPPLTQYRSCCRCTARLYR